MAVKILKKQTKEAQKTNTLVRKASSKYANS